MKNFSCLFFALAALVLTSCGAFDGTTSSADEKPVYSAQPKSNEVIVQYPNVDNKPTYGNTTRPNVNNTVAPTRPN